MKLRIQGNSLRVRIQQQELADLHASGVVRESLVLGETPAARLAYALVAADADGLSIDFSDQCIAIHVPRRVISEMVDTDRVGVSGEVAVNEYQKLSILVEKDFKCLTPRSEDVDAFPHPEAEAGHNC